MKCLSLIQLQDAVVEAVPLDKAMFFLFKERKHLGSHMKQQSRQMLVAIFLPSLLLSQAVAERLRDSFPEDNCLDQYLKMIALWHISFSSN